MQTRIDETLVARAPLAQAWDVLVDLAAVVGCVPTAHLVAGTDPGTVLARVTGFNASARVAARDDATRLLRCVGGARAADGPAAAAVSLTIVARARTAGTTDIHLEGDVELLGAGDAAVPRAAIRAFVEALRLRVERPPAPTTASPPLAVPSLAATGLTPAYRPPGATPPAATRKRDA